MVFSCFSCRYSQFIYCLNLDSFGSHKANRVNTFSGGQDSISLFFFDFAPFVWCNHFWKLEDFYLLRHSCEISFLFHRRFFYTLFFSKNFSEQKARKYRYLIFRRIAIFSHFQIIQTAHTKNDNIETFFLHLFRGSGGFSILQDSQNFLVHDFSQKFF